MGECFETAYEELPQEIAIFPLPGVILLPRAQLPLNIFERRYLALADFALSSSRLIGMVQPKGENIEGEVYATGCAGRICSFAETDDGRYLVTLKGVSRFKVAEELPLSNGGFRRVRADWEPYKADFEEAEMTDLCRDTMMGTLRQYLDKMNMFCDKWETIRSIECEKLVSTLAVVCPFEPKEKQALLEAPDLRARARLLQALLENATRDETGTACH